MKMQGPSAVPKTEFRNSKFETNPNFKTAEMFKTRLTEWFRAFEFRILSWFRISDFGFRISSPALAPGCSKPPAHRTAVGYMLTEALVYIGLLVVVLGVGYQAMYRCVYNSAVLRRNAEDISRAMHAGERWRADVRAADKSVRVETAGDVQVLYLLGAINQVTYRFEDGALYRRFGSGGWARVLERVKTTSFQADPRGRVSAWRWELELQPQEKANVKAGRIRPLFTFLAVAPAAAAP